MRFLLFLLSVALAACAPTRIEAPPPDAAFTARAIGFLDTLQQPSIAGDREYCGYFGLDAEGDFAASDPEEGGVDYCAPTHPQDMSIVASYHTHGAYGPEHDTEVPSPEDVDSDVAEGVFGYVGTPGGRVWLIDWRTGTATSLCGTVCIARDPGFNAREAGPVGRVYTREGLRRRFGY